MLLTVKEPPRGFSDPQTGEKVQKANMMETFRELLTKPTFWTMSIGAALTALVGYGLTAFQSPMMGRLHGVNPSAFAWEFGGPLAIFAALGTFAGGFIIDKWAPRQQQAVAWVPAIGLLLAIPLYTVARPVWFAGVFFHYMYLGSQYTIGQGVVSQRSRASAVAILLLLIALLGNAPGPLITGWLSDMFMGMELKDAGVGGVLTGDLCRNAAEVAKLAADQQATCAAAYGEGLRSSMVATVLIFMPAALFFFLCSLTLKKDMLAKPV
jgi:hypothetical protein